MDNIEKILKAINESIGIKADLYKVKDIIIEDRIINLKDEEIKKYLNMPISKFLALLKIKRLHDNKVIDKETKETLIELLDGYYRMNEKIAELSYTYYISDMDEYSDILNNYYDIKEQYYSQLKRYNIMFNTVDNNIGDMLTQNMDKIIKKDKRKIRKK